MDLTIARNRQGLKIDFIAIARREPDSFPQRAGWLERRVYPDV
jgi:hypothetical protein